MALTQITLNGAIAAADTVLKLSATGVAVGHKLKVDGEFMLVQNTDQSPTIKVERGQDGTLAVAHNTLATSVYGPAADFLDAQPEEKIASYGVSGAIDIPNVDTTIAINKASAAAMTLASPAVDQDGLELMIVSNSAAAHTVTYTPGFYGDTTSSDVATFAAKVGASMTIVAQRGLWGIKSLANVTLG